MQDLQAGTHEPHHHFVAEDWQRIEGEPQFQNLVKTKRRFIIPATVIFIVYYFSLPILVGYFPEMMSRKVIGSVSLAYLFALSQFFMAWIIMGLYLRRAKRFDELEHEVVSSVRGEFTAIAPEVPVQ
ncbi:MAG: DUF485 domain-containing protein [Vulcanimicrobiaceae bacterium]